ncbi:isopentenyl-diphosphate delta-isomerase [Dietzia kunjamensis]|uniref:isopentenyl-diphosphate Delta-isomerase n=1 Tax=Dietzia kunjamensis TaxID=322509 RepID=UPI000E753122|nr:isopentenyl-diphosphate Delta-isomerase [Dietzia kunjamensis]MBB1012527.1 isopentenyl-diphosphate Delta-isomerase [Dietzia kunjamensis]RKE65154.1 isopentenyl-diphosphate delta-isomerase [Dietzia kunjamensis]
MSSPSESPATAGSRATVSPSGPAELVVLLDDDGNPIGTADKATVHTTDTPLHLAFSCHVVDDEGHVLLTRRALDKRTWPGIWTNSFCGHPGPGEDPVEAIVRRAEQELGTRVDSIEPAVPDFRYRAVDDSGIVENEICPVFTARIRAEVNPRADEVCAHHWARPADVRTSVDATPFAFSPWLVAQVPRMELYSR